MSFKLGKKSLSKLEGVNPDLVAVTKLAIKKTPIDFAITCGLRTKEEQARLVASGASTTMRSKHISGRAVDVAAIVDNQARWEPMLYSHIAKAFFESAKELGIKIRWGGDWNCNGDSGDEKFFDGPHFELM